MGVSSTDRMAGQESFWKRGESSILTANITIESFLWGPSQTKLTGGNRLSSTMNLENVSISRVCLQFMFNLKLLICLFSLFVFNAIKVSFLMNFYAPVKPV